MPQIQESLVCLTLKSSVGQITLPMEFLCKTFQKTPLTGQEEIESGTTLWAGCQPPKYLRLGAFVWGT